MGKILEFIKVLFFIFLCGFDPRRYYRFKALGFEILGKFGLYEKKHFEFIQRHIGPASIAIDIGAHFGVYTKLFLDKVSSAGLVVAFEPFPAAFDALQKRFEDNANCMLFPFAISNKTGRFWLDVPKLWNLVPEPALGSVTDLETKGSYEIETRALDEVAPEFEISGLTISVIKVDVEGHELSFFEGAKACLTKHRPIVMFEDNKISERIAKYQRLGEDLGYSLCALGETLELQVIGERFSSSDYNFYFVPREKI